ncbi:MAG: AAA family ATPase, partial [Bacteroidales bacterium]|nr:AAA family ATPase [Bacteroidales bacterium]
MDKTGLIAHTNSVLRTKQKYLCVSRPLRFGKSTAEDMLAAYYECGDDSRAMFEPFEIAAHSSFNQYLNRYNVVMLNIQNFLSWAKNDIANMEELIAKILITELRKEYGDIVDDGFGILRMTIDVVAKQTNIPFIFLIDEWDCIFRIHQ